MTGLVDKAGDAVKKFVVNIAIKKAVVSAAKLIVSYCATKGLIFVGTFFGVVVDTGSVESIQAALTLGINSILTMIRNYAKTKWPAKFSWL